MLAANFEKATFYRYYLCLFTNGFNLSLAVDEGLWHLCANVGRGLVGRLPTGPIAQSSRLTPDRACIAARRLVDGAMDRDFFASLSGCARAAIAAAMADGLAVTDKAGDGADGNFDPVTEADRRAERALRSAIGACFPDDAIWGEEYGWSREGARRVWSLDPVDGTRALVCGLASWAVLVGVVDDGVHVGGMIDLPAVDETLIALDGATWRGETRVATSGCAGLADARLSTTDPYLFDGADAAGFERVRRAAKVTRYGLDAMAYARVATGDIDLVVENGLKRHDYDALVAVVRGAGGHVGDWRGGDDLLGGAIVAASTRTLYDQAVALLA